MKCATDTKMAPLECIFLKFLSMFVKFSNCMKLLGQVTLFFTFKCLHPEKARREGQELNCGFGGIGQKRAIVGQEILKGRVRFRVNSEDYKLYSIFLLHLHSAVSKY